MTYHIGIDPGSGANNGFAVVDEREEIMLMETGKRAYVFGLVCACGMLEFSEGDTLIVHIEDPRLIPTVYARNRRGMDARGLRIAQNVGQNKAIAAVIIEDLEALGVTVHRHAPSGAKWTAETVKALGWTGRSSQHARDALRVALQGMRKCDIGQSAGAKA